jgi:hypothetical protein
MRQEGTTSDMERAALGLGLGLLSVGLGPGELVAPRALARLVGVGSGGRTRPVVRGLGARELLVGAGLLAGRRPGPWLWGRVAGDLVDLAVIALGARRARKRGRTWGALAAVAGVTALDAMAAVAASRSANDVQARGDPIGGDDPVGGGPGCATAWRARCPRTS